jgi:histone H3/H4
MQVMNCMMNQLATRVYNEAIRASRMKGRVTVGEAEIRLALQRILPAELSKHAYSEVEKASAKYLASLA